jgi:M6 family metalloprotease-like protein
MLFISQTLLILLALMVTAHATTVAVPMDENITLVTPSDYRLESVTASTTLNASDSNVRSVAVNSASLLQGSAGIASVSQPVLLLRLSFTDQEFSYSRSEFQDLIFSTAAGANSVAQYYLENSYQQFRIQPAQETQGIANDGIVDVRLPYAHPNFGENYGSRSQALVRDALAQVDAYINLKSFDRNGDALLSSSELAVVLMVAGYENAYGGSSAPQPRVWAHKSDISGVSLDGIELASFAMFGEQHQNHLATIGIISHEMGHLLFGLPDLYDRQGDSNGIGRWGLMGLGSWNSRGGYSGSSPAHMMAWSKAKAGFLRPDDVMGNELEFSLGSATHVPEVMRVWLDPFRHGEHFLLEYRQQSNLDSALPGEGLLISHADDWVGYGSAGPQNDIEEHKLVDIEEADGLNDLDQLENRGDRLDVYNDAYGQDYFGSSSSPASLDYHGNMSGVEISNIRIAGEAKGTITLPYKELGDNLGYDNKVGVAWGVRGKQTQSLVALALPQNLPWAHGVDIFSPGAGELSVSLYAHLVDGRVGGEIYVAKDRSVSRGWNRISFAERVDLSAYSQVYLQVLVYASSERPFSIDNKSIASGQSYTESNGLYQQARFDFNQRLLVANQQEAFNYQVPKAVDFSSKVASKSSGGGYWLSIFSFFLLLLALRVRRFA